MKSKSFVVFVYQTGVFMYLKGCPAITALFLSESFQPDLTKYKSARPIAAIGE